MGEDINEHIILLLFKIAYKFSFFIILLRFFRKFISKIPAVTRRLYPLIVNQKVAICFAVDFVEDDL